MAIVVGDPAYVMTERGSIGAPSFPTRKDMESMLIAEHAPQRTLKLLHVAVATSQVNQHFHQPTDSFHRRSSAQLRGEVELQTCARSHNFYGSVESVDTAIDIPRESDYESNLVQSIPQKIQGGLLRIEHEQLHVPHIPGVRINCKYTNEKCSRIKRRGALEVCASCGPHKPLSL